MKCYFPTSMKKQRPWLWNLSDAISQWDGRCSIEVWTGAGAQVSVCAALVVLGLTDPSPACVGRRTLAWGFEAAMFWGGGKLAGATKWPHLGTLCSCYLFYFLTGICRGTLLIVCWPYQHSKGRRQSGFYKELRERLKWKSGKGDDWRSPPRA